MNLLIILAIVVSSCAMADPAAQDTQRYRTHSNEESKTPLASDGRQQTRIDALTRILEVQLELYKSKDAKAIAFREQMETNIFVFILLAIGGFITLRPRVRFTTALTPKQILLRKISIVACLSMSFFAFGVFFYGVDTNNRVERNYAEACLASLSRRLAHETGFAERDLLPFEEISKRTESLRETFFTKKGLANISGQDAFKYVHVVFPFQLQSKKIWLNYLAFAVFVFSLFPAVYTIFKLLEPFEEKSSD
jgi:hypothetical protein